MSPFKDPTFLVFAVGLLMGLALVTFSFYQNQKRAKLELKFDLIPNCLLTRRPLLFLTGQRSLFYFLNYWNQIPEYLAGHGYEVFTLPLSWRNPKKRQKVLKSFLQSAEQKNKKYHILFDSSILPELQDLLSEAHYEAAESLTVIQSLSAKIPPPANSVKPLKHSIEELSFSVSSQAPWIWRAHQLFSQKKIMSLRPISLGFAKPCEVSTVCYEFLQRAQFLAERDLTKNS